MSKNSKDITALAPLCVRQGLTPQRLPCTSSTTLWSGGPVEIVDRYDLLAADSFQLAATLEWYEEASQGRVFLTADRRLREAALLSGLDAKQM